MDYHQHFIREKTEAQGGKEHRRKIQKNVSGCAVCDSPHWKDPQMFSGRTDPHTVVRTYNKISYGNRTA